MNKGGRPKDSVWAMFERSQDQKAKCKNCQALVSSKADRLKSHLNRCSPKENETAQAASQTSSLQVRAEKRPVPDDFETPPAPKRMQTGLWGHFISTPSLTKEKIDQCVAEFVFGCNLPFSVVEHPLFRTLVETLRPGYRPPSRKTLSSTLLDQEHNKLHSTMRGKLEGKTVTMQQDGWSTLHNDPVISTSVTCEGNGYFIDAQYSGANAKTAEYCQEMLLKSKTFAENTYGCKVKTIVTDNARNMSKMREALEKVIISLVLIFLHKVDKI